MAFRRSTVRSRLSSTMLSPEQRELPGSATASSVVPRFAGPDVCKAMLERVSELCARAESGARRRERAAPGRAGAARRAGQRGRAHVEAVQASTDTSRCSTRSAASRGCSRWCRRCSGPTSTASCRSSSSRTRGALGQPWHQDAFYFPFDRRPQVGVWLAVTEATLENGPLWVLPGSQREPIHPVEPDRREHAQMGYVEITDHDMSGERAGAARAGRPAPLPRPPDAQVDRQPLAPACARPWSTTTARPGTVDRTLEFRDVHAERLAAGAARRRAACRESRRCQAAVHDARARPRGAARARARAARSRSTPGVLDGRVERRSDALGLVQVRLGRSPRRPGSRRRRRSASSAARRAGETARNLDHFCLRIEPFAADELRAHLAAHGIEAGERAPRYGADGNGPSLYMQRSRRQHRRAQGPARAERLDARHVRTLHAAHREGGAGRALRLRPRRSSRALAAALQRRADRQDVLAVRAGRRPRRREPACSCAGGWCRRSSKAIGAQALMINARVESLADEARLRATRSRAALPGPGRRLLRVAGRQAATRARSMPHLVARADGEPFAMAGLFARWRRRGDALGEALLSCAIDHHGGERRACAQLHDRMPVILPREAEARWLDPAPRRRHRRRCSRCSQPVAGGRAAHAPGLAARELVQNDDPSLLAPRRQRAVARASSSARSSRTRSTTLPKCVLASTRSCAACASASGSTLVDDRAQLAALERREEARAEAAHDLGLLRDRPRAQGRADHREALRDDAGRG